MLSEIRLRLQGMFARELSRGQSRHIVFWYDDAGEYATEMDQLHLDGVHVIRGDDRKLFQIKYELEEVFTQENILLYFPHPQPEIHEDWLRDVYEYSTAFNMDEIALLLDELGLEDMGLRVAFEQYKVFFRARDRREDFRRVAVRLAIEDEDTLDLAVFTALTKAPLPDFFTIVKHLFSEEVNRRNQPWAQLVRFGREDVFWRWTKRYFGYPLKEGSPSLEHFLASMLATHAADELSLPIRSHGVTALDPVNSEVFINQWQNDPRYQGSYRLLARQYEERLGVSAWLEHLSEESLIYADTFPVFDEHLINEVIERLQEDGQDYERYAQWLNARRTTHWYDRYAPVYQTLQAAITLKTGLARLEQEGLADEGEELFAFYCREGYRLDMAYRHFYRAYDRIQTENKGLDEVRDQVEYLYVHHFLSRLDDRWSRALEEKGRLQLAEVPAQTEFYAQFVEPFRQRRVFVIISDAFRYELARELTDRLNSQHRFSTHLQAMTGVIPSYTALGMASLLPHQSLSLTNGKISVDGYDIQGTRARGEVLAAKEPASVALTYTELQASSRDELRQRFNGQKVIYIYHNQVDQRGESGPGEHEVFTAGNEAIVTLEKLVNKLFTTVSAAHILITADHGFLYTRDPLPESERRPRAGLNGELENRRFIVNNDGTNQPGTLTLPFPATSAEPMYVHTPRGTTRFITQGGGENYVHGGAMLQEITIPVVHIKTDRKGARLGEALASIQLTSVMRKLTNSVTYLDFLQREQVAGKVRPAWYLAFFVDQEGQTVSNVVHVLADSTSAKPQGRILRKKFVLSQRAYHPEEDYDLLITYEDGTEYERIPFTIDIPWQS